LKVRQINVRLNSVTGINTGVSEDILGVYKTIFSTILGRRLGTQTDGTTLRANPLAGVAADLDDLTIEHFPANTRDVTLYQHIKLNLSLIKELTDY
jgi:hypothetical protein